MNEWISEWHGEGKKIDQIDFYECRADPELETSGFSDVGSWGLRFGVQVIVWYRNWKQTDRHAWQWCKGVWKFQVKYFVWAKHSCGKVIVLDTIITIEVVTKELVQLLNTIMSSSFKWEVNMCVCMQRICCEEHCGDGVSDGSDFLD